ncbi:MAG: glycosyltransferase involved in cell wall biosynthesis [Myxococcota bacterium]
MRITYLLPASGIPVQGPSGASAHARGIVRALRRDHEVRLLAAKITDRRGTFGEPTRARAVGVPGWPSWLKTYRDLTEVIAARRISRRIIEQAHAGWRPDLIIERHSLFSDAGWRVHDRLGVPWVLEVNAPLWEERRRFEVLRRPGWALRWQQEVLQAAPCIVAVSRWLVDWLQDDMGCDNVHWLPNGVDLRLGDRVAGRARLGVAPGEKVIGFVGSMKPWHGLDRLVGVAKATGARLALVGRLAPGMIAPQGALVTGHLEPDALADTVAALDVGLAPYPADAPPWFCPLKILDYRAQGTPVVATDVGECRALVGDAGSVVPADDDAALTREVARWLSRPRPAPAARTWQEVSEKLLALSGVPPQ